MINLKRLSITHMAAVALAMGAVVAGCGGSTGGGMLPIMPPAHTPPPGGSQVLNTATLKGSPGFVNAAGFTTYVFDLDLTTPGQSSCNGACAQNWPPVAPPSSSLPSPWSSIHRQDGTMQLAYNGRPLYLFAGDSAPGQTFGDGLNAFGGLWHIARPQASSASPAPAASSSASSAP